MSSSVFSNSIMSAAAAAAAATSTVGNSNSKTTETMPVMPTPWTVPSTEVDSSKSKSNNGIKRNSNNNNSSVTVNVVDHDVTLIDEMIWADVSDKYASNELAPRPRGSNYGDHPDPCGCIGPGDICTDESCVLYACQEECQECLPNCRNQRITKKQWKDVQVFDAGPHKGRGLQAMEEIRQGDFILEYVGKAIRKAYLDRLFSRYKTERMLYIMALDHDIYIDARSMGGVARYINHSCHPNCRVERWNVKGVLRAGIFAIRNISKGEELSFDYQWDRKRGRAATKCYCQSYNCRGTLEVPKSMEEEQMEHQLKTHWLKPTSKAGAEIMNRTIRIYSKENGEFFSADICKYDPESGKHMVMYRNCLEEAWEDLSQEDWDLLDEEASSIFVIGKKQKQLQMGSDGRQTSLLGATEEGQGEAMRDFQNFFYVSTEIKNELNAKGFINNVGARFGCSADIEKVVSSESDVQEIQQLESNDGLLWKISVSGVNLQNACAFLEKNIVKLRHQEQVSTRPSQRLLQNQPSIDEVVDIEVQHAEVIIPRCAVDCVSRKLGSIRDRCKSVNITFAPSESKSKKFAKMQLDAVLPHDLKVATEVLWALLQKSCEESNAPKVPSSGAYKDLGFFAGELSSEAFDMLVNNREKDRLCQEANEDLRRSLFFSSFENAQSCTVWVQATDDMGRIDSSNRVISEFNPSVPRRIYFGCEPSRVPTLWKLIAQRANDHLRGIRFINLGADRPMMMHKGSMHFLFVDQVTGASVTTDPVTGDHLRIDGGTQDITIGDWDSEQTLRPSDIALLAEELIRLQIELYRDYFARQQSWIFGRDWSLAPVAGGPVKDDSSTSNSTRGVPVKSFSSPTPSRSLTTKSNRFEPRSVSNACMDIAEIVHKSGIIASAGAHASVIMYRFLKIIGESEDICPGLKIRDIVIASIFLANKAQKVSKWKRLDALLESAYPVFFHGSKFNRDDQGAVNFENKVIHAESEILKVLEYDVFWTGVEWAATAAIESGIVPEPIARNALDYLLSGPVLAAGAELWLKFGAEYVFTAIVGFLGMNIEPLLGTLSIFPFKVLKAAQIIAQSMEVNGSSRKSTRDINGGPKSFLNNLESIDEVCKRCTSEYAKSGNRLINAGEASMRYKLIGQRDNGRLAFKAIPETLLRETIVPIIDAICAESKCRIFVSGSETTGSEDLIVEGSWRALAIAEYLLSATCAQADGSLPLAVNLLLDDVNSQLSFKTCSGTMTMDDISTADGWEGTIQSKVATGESTFGRKVGGKACEAGRIQESHLRKAGLRWWIPPMYAPSPTGSIHEMLCVRNAMATDNARLTQLQELSSLGTALVGVEKLEDLFPKLASFDRPTKDGQQREERFVAVSMQRWPPEKIDNKEQGKNVAEKTVSTGFSPAALQELQLLTELHSLIPSPTGHPNLILPVAIALPYATEEKADAHGSGEFGETKVDDIFSLFRTSEENERKALREKKRRDRASGPHIVFDPIPFLLTRAMERSSKNRRNDVQGTMISPMLFSAWFHDLLSALVHCHTNHVILRSVQTDQILIDHSGVAKLAGFYRATVLPYHERTKTANHLRNAKSRKEKSDDGDDVNPYSAPELLLGSLKHTKETDIWAIGSMMAHLLLGKPLFLGKERSGLLLAMFKIIGSPAKDNYPEASKFPFAVKSEKRYKRGVEKAFQRMMKEEDYEKHEKAIDLMVKMLHLDPLQRITAVEALKHEYIQNYTALCNDKPFRDKYVDDWMCMKKELNHSNRVDNDHVQKEEKSLKRKAMLEAAVGADDDIDDDLHDIDDLLENRDSDGATEKKTKVY